MPIPKMHRTVTVVTPSLDGRGPMERVTCAYLQRLPGDMPMFTLIIPPDVPLTAESEVVDGDQHRYRVVGEPAGRSNLGPHVLFQGAALQRVAED